MPRIPIGETNMILAQIINIVFDKGPISSADIGELIGRSREYVDVYIRQARALHLIHVEPVTRSISKPVPAMLFVFGWGVDSVRRQPKGVPRAPNKPNKTNKKEREAITPQHDPAMLAFFGRSA
jgi:hypothetical protein